ncbi:uncharacterized protein LOC123701279 isoform X1 [Colias croceus]|uniref:uncharacterized protein LOC123701279 isoform X1 n=1 Tax=Colias crocea TaxID=72248 RepID=UPI001E27F101|nr:uncharacterized protein LOC123701279 isoform X1 [Colias croceus]XP_045504656.1 uncharacterized protein LOC123701279 isoform X1 [Colias croceus]
MLSDFAKEKVFWTRKMNLNLVKFIQSRPNIWNPKHPKYTSSESKDQTYAEFAAKYGDEFSGQAVKERWTNIRSTFANYLRKVKASSDSQSEPYKVNWHLWEPCQFLVKVNRSYRNDTGLDEEKITKNTSDSEEQNQDWASDHSQDSFTNPTKLTCMGIAENLLSVFKGVQNDAFGLENSKNSKIGKAVVEKLNQMDSLEAAKVSMKILEILWMYDENNPINPNNLKPELF